MPNLKRIRSRLDPSDLNELREHRCNAAMPMSVQNPAPLDLGDSPSLAEHDEPIPLSFAQQRLWFLDQLEPNMALYNVPLALRLAGLLDRAALHAALNEIVARHETLRTNIACENGSAAQRIRAPHPIQLRTIDLSGRKEPQREDELKSLLCRHAQRPFDLAQDPLIRATLFRVGERDHVLLLSLHHVVCDEWSLRILLKELALLYNAFCRGEPLVLPELPIQYSDYAIWQREWLESALSAKQLDYWKHRLRGAAPRLELPTDHRLCSNRSHAGRRQTVELPRALSSSLRELSRGEGVTLFISLLASFKVLLARYTGQDDITIGSPIAGRTRVETEDLIGFFVNTLVLRTDLSGDPTFLEVLRRTRETTLGAYDHQDIPFDRLVHDLQPARRVNDMPFVQAMFAFEHALEEDFKLPDMDVQQIDVDMRTSKFDLTWAVRESRQTLGICVEYSTELFEDETILRMARHWRNLLHGIVAEPNQRMSRFSLLDSDERQKILVEWNRTDRPYPQEATIPALFQAQVQRRPDAVALRYGSRDLTYTELNQRANQLAHLLRDLGVESDVPVALCADRSIDSIVGMLGVLKAGGAYVPLDPGYPAERLSLILEDTGAKIILTQQHLRAALPPTQAKILCLDSQLPAPSTDLAPPVHADALAYIIYTSGSTGRPKGVLVTQRAILRLVCNTDYIQLTPDDRVAQASNICFDAATFEIWGALLHGAMLVGFSHDVLLSPKEFAAQLGQDRITTLFLTTALFNQVAEESPGAFRSLKQLLFGGESVDSNRVRHVLKHQPPARLLHVYGPTETTTFASWHAITDVPPTATTVPIGRPVANTRIYLLDRWLEPVPIGVAGEVFIGGPGVARGYLNQPALTAERFVPDPFSDEPGARLYKTGDLARYQPGGTLEFVGRSDHQVKIRGFRVELGEIEAVLSTHPAVRETVVIAREGEPSLGKRLVAYVTLKNGHHGSTVDDVRRFLKEKLPAYMVPTQLIPLTNLPLNANGKVDRGSLPLSDQARPEVERHLRAPRNAVEEKLTRIWSEVLRLDRVGVQDNFFDLGGHSLLAVRLFSAIEHEFGKQLPLASLFRWPTIEQLAQQIRTDAPAPSWPLLVDIQPHGSRPPVFWVHSLGGDGGGAFFYYRRLAQLLGDDQPSFGIRSPQEPFTDLKEMAVHYVNELIRFQPKSPYLLGGFCFGGIVAFEMASELHRRGGRVGLLALLESVPPGRIQAKVRWGPASVASLARNLQSWLADLWQNPADLRHRLQRKVKSIQKRFSPLRKGPAPPALDDLIDMAEYPRDYIRFAQAHWQALSAYEPRPYPGCITLFRARKQPLFSLDPTLGWGALAQEGIAVNVIPGSHEKMLEEPNVHILAAELKLCLVEAQALNPELPERQDAEDAAAIQRAGASSCPCSIIT